MEKRRQEEPDWIAPDFPMALPTGEDADYFLGNPTVVEALIRNALDRIYADRKRESEGQEPEAGPDYITANIDQVVQTLLGRGNRHVLISDVWNADDPRSGIAESVKRAYGLEQVDGTAQEIVAFPIYLLLETLTLAEELERAGQDWEHLVDGDMEKLVAAFIGAPDPSD